MARTLKNQLRQFLRSKMKEGGGLVFHATFAECTVDFLNLVSGSSPHSAEFWKRQVRDQ